MPDFPIRNLLESMSAQLQQEAEALAEGGARDALLRKAAKMENAARIAEMWASSPGLRAPR